MNFAIASALPSSAIAPDLAAIQHRKLTDAAQQFEGMLLEEMLKPMKEHGFAQQEGDDSDEEDDNSGGDTLSSFGSETLATALSRSGGLGIAKRIVAQVEGEKTEREQAAHAPSSSSPSNIPK